MRVSLYRIAQSDDGTFGVLVIGNRPICVTCEDPWKKNETNISCIPTGRYQVAPFSGARYKNVWQVLDVPGRTAILIHQGNNINDTQGCILVGDGYSMLEGVPSITRSGMTLERLREILPAEFELEIRNGFKI